jgi:hypothetical protein
LGAIFLGWFEHNSFVPAPELSKTGPDRYATAAKNLLSAFQVGQTLVGIDRKGRPVSARIEQTNPAPDLGEYSVNLSYPNGSLRQDALFGTKVLPIRILRRESASLSPDIDLKLRDRANQLWLHHLSERALDERNARFTLGSPNVERVASAPELLVVQFPVDMEEPGGSHDDRGSMFFIYSRTEHRIIRGEFGHPEWAPGSSVLTIKPEFYFRMGTNASIFFVGVHQGGWEDWATRSTISATAGTFFSAIDHLVLVKCASAFASLLPRARHAELAPRHGLRAADFTPPQK